MAAVQTCVAKNRGTRVVGPHLAAIGFITQVALELVMTDIQYISDESGNPTAVIVPIELWREIESEKETAYLLKSGTMKRRLLEAKERQAGIPLEEAREKLGI